jgi:hypothetical protein
MEAEIVFGEKYISCVCVWGKSRCGQQFVLSVCGMPIISGFVHMASVITLKNFYVLFILYKLVNKINPEKNFFCMFISILHRFRASMCPSSGKITVFVRHLVFVTLCGWPSGVHDGMKLSFNPAYQTVIHTEWQMIWYDIYLSTAIG